MSTRYGVVGHSARPENRRGTIIVLSAFLMIVMAGILALSIDIGYMYNMQTQADRAVDAAALAGAAGLVSGVDSAQDQVVEFIVRNPVGGAGITAVNEQNLAALKAQFLAENGNELDVQYGSWDPTTRSFTQDASSPSSINVVMNYPNKPFFFGRVFGQSSFSVQSKAIATYRPRDIFIVVDLSASMNDDTDLAAISSLGQSAVESSFQTMWTDLGSPTYGNMSFTPDWVTIPGVTHDVDVTWRSGYVDITSSQPMEYVKITTSSGYTYTYSTSSSSGTWGSGSRLTKCQVRINGVWETFDFYDNSHIRRGLGLDSVPYPGTNGSWDEFIEHCRDHSSSMSYYYDYDVYAAGYRRKFGGMLLLNYWNIHRSPYTDTDFLWQLTQQPIGAVKNAADEFVNYVSSAAVDDQIGVAIYNSSNGEGSVELSLSNNFAAVKNAIRSKQAGHYHGWTNIGAGMQSARLALTANARPGAYKMMVLLTDGQANWNSGQYNSTAAVQMVRDEAALAKAAGINIMTISLGAGADKTLMEEVATTADGVHFNIPGGGTVAQYSLQLTNVFKQIAASRPLMLVH